MCDRLVEALSLDETSRIERQLVAIHSQRVDGSDVRMFELARDFGLADEPFPATLIPGEVGHDPFQRDRAIEMLIMGDEDLA